MIVLDIQLPVQGVFDAGLAAGLWFSPGTTISSTNKTDSHDIAEILLKVALNTIKQTKLFLRNFYNV
jgi:hypothetical protein